MDFLTEYGKNKDKIRDFLKSAKNKTRDEIFFELCFCLLTPQSKAEKCRYALKKMDRRILLSEDEKEIVLHLTGVRFNRNKAGYIVLARENFYAIYEKILVEKDTYALREWLVKNVKGFGYKEASHFLRNIGLGENLAILDRHVLREMKFLGNLTKKNYLEYEKRFQDFARKLGLKPAELDIAIWRSSSGSREIM